MVGSSLAEAGVCKDAGGAFAKGAASLIQGSLELVTDAVSLTHDVLGYKVSTWTMPHVLPGTFACSAEDPYTGFRTRHVRLSIP